MIDRPNGEHLTPEQMRARDSVRGLIRVRASDEFRQRLHQEFVSGEMAEEGQPRRVQQVSGSKGFFGRFGWILAPAAAVILVAIIALFNQTPQWIVDPLSEAGYVLVDGQRLDMTEVESLPDLLRPGSEIETHAGAHFEIRRSGYLIVEVTTETALTMLNSPGRWFGRTMRTHVSGGEVRFLTGPEFSGSGLEVTTPDGRIEVAGTIVAVNCDETGTCVCVMDGTALVGVDSEDMEEVPSGMRKVMPREDDPFITAIKPMHKDGILELRDRHPEMRKLDE